MTYKFKMSRRLAMVYGLFGLLYFAQTSCQAPQAIAGFTPPTDTSVVALQVTPGADTTSVSQLVQLRAVAVNAAGDPIPAPIDWSATGGSVDTAGRFSASAAGSYWVKARHRHQNAITDSASVVVLPAAVTLTRLTLAPSSVTLLPGASQNFSVTGQWSDGSTSTPAVNYTVTSGTISGGGLYTAGNTPGTYRVIATQPSSGLADTSVVTIAQPPATLTQLTIAPGAVTLLPGAAQPFTVSGQWSDGSTAAPAVTFSATGGTINASGLYVAGSTSGAFRVIATQQGGTIADTAAVTITTPPATLTAIVLSPSSATLTVGGTRQFSVSGQWSDGSSAAPAVTYSATGGSVTSGGLYTAGSTAGTFRVIATQQGGTLADTSVITLNPPALTKVTVAPSSAALLAGATQQFTASGQYSDGSTGTPSVTWSATGGSVNSGGLFTAGATAGTFRVIATQQGGSLADTSSITITVPAPTQTQVILTPSSVSLLSGASQQYSVSGRLSDGSSNTPAVNYTATGGTVTSGGRYTAGSSAGTFRVIATLQGGTLADTSAVTITVPAPTLTQVILTPTSASVQGGATRQFSVSGQMSDGSTTTPAVTYSATGGTITSGGLFTAGSTAGTFRVIATQQGGTLADTSAVTVTVTAPVLTQILVTPVSATVVAGSSFQFSSSGRMSDGSSSSPAVTWTATGGTVSASGFYTAGSTTGSFRVIATQQGGTLADTSTVTISSGSTGPGSVFYADWSSTTGTSSSALTSGGKWDDNIGPHNNIAVVSGSATPGAPTANVYRVTNSVLDLGYNWVEKANLWVNPQVGETRYWRVYLYNATDDSQGSLGPEASYHPLEFASPVYNGMEQWNLILSTNGNGTFPFKFAPLAASFPKNRWIPSNGSGVQAYPKKFRWYRIEWSLTKTAPSVFTLHARIAERDPNTGVETVMWDDNSIRDASLNQTLAAAGTGITGIDDQAVGQMRIGTNGGSVWSALSSDQYIYWAGVCVRSDTWCGSYAAGEH